MLLDLIEVSSGRKESLVFDDRLVLEDLSFLGQHTVIKSGEFHVHGQVLRISDELVLQLNYSGQLYFVCERCLDSLEYMPVSKVYKALSKQEDEEDVVIYSGNQLNLIQVVEDDILLNLPIQVTCSKTCKGLCATCGVNLNTESCACNLEKIDSRLESLKDFFNNKEEV